MRDYDIENAKQELKNKIEEFKAYKTAWEGVKRVTKKDGSDFSILSKNFEGCRFYDCRFSMKNAIKEKEISVTGRTASGRWVTSTMSTTLTIQNYDEKEKAKYEDRLIKENFLNPYIIYTAKEIEQMIKARIDQYTDLIRQYEKDLQVFDKAIEAYKTILEQAHNVLKESGLTDSSIYKIQRITFN